ncbi:PAS domain-containing protein [Sanguibacter sp. Z1732]|uniref:PAS domain-containing protein n=1 Tax=Sanguibacter sp. Z1732 TaxID=3435412 RepID=UPI003D9CB784
MGPDATSEATESVEMVQATAREDAVRALLEGDFAIGVWDRHGGAFRAVWVNEAFTEVTGYTLQRAQALGEGILRPGYRAVIAEQVDEVGPQSDPLHTSLPIRTTDGEDLDVPVTLTVRHDPETGEARRLIFVQRQAATTAEQLLPEHHSRRALEVVAKISEILVDFDEPMALSAIARMVGAGCTSGAVSSSTTACCGCRRTSPSTCGYATWGWPAGAPAPTWPTRWHACCRGSGSSR